jgi:hypothetical protein
MTYSEDAAELLRKARDANEERAEAITATYGGLAQYADRVADAMAPVNDRRMELAAAFTRLAELEPGADDGAILPHESEMRTGDALNLAGTFGTTDGEHHKMWVIDQIVRLLTGCPTVQKTATDAHGAEYTYDALGESEEYLSFTREAGDWDEGIAP